MLSLAVGSFQFMLDRGADQDWFSSWEIIAEAGIAAAAAWMFIVHTITDREPFVHKGLFTDRNFAAALIFIFIIGIILLATMALLPPMLTNLYGYPVITVGLVLAPRGMGTMMTMLVVGRLVSKVDPRVLVLFGLGLTAYSLWQMTYFTPDMGWWPIVESGVIQGLGMGFVFIPLSTVAFQTLPPMLRTEASALFNLVRNLGSSIGVSIMATMLTRNIATMHASLATHITPFNSNLTAAGIDTGSFTSAAGQQTAAIVDLMINQQAAIVAYLDDFKLMFWITLSAAPLLLLLRHQKTPQAAPAGRPAQQQESPAMAMAE
jgi:DHA2 family multidrug resistance protein